MPDHAQNAMRRCTLCPRLCGADRLAGRTGVCGAGSEVKVFRWGPHFGEEPPISGTRGSGTVFFSHCPLGCIYCQNHPWTAGGRGQVVGTTGLAGILSDLAAKGCHNWNLVTPEPWMPCIREAVRLARSAGAGIPTVCNTSGYARVETAAEYRELCDIALVDLRYASARCASEASRAPDYPETARAFVRWCCEKLGPLRLDENGIASGGTVIRLLVLPGRADEAVESLRWIRNECGAEIPLSLMSQYTPVHAALGAPGWDRTITEEEFARVTDEAARLGLEEGWTQPWGSAAGDDAMLGQNMAPGEGTVSPSPAAAAVSPVAGAPVEAGLSFGSNLGDRRENLRRAIRAVSELPGVRLVAASGFYETEPVDVPERFASLSYLNAVAVFEVSMALEEWSRRCHAVEDALGRVRTGYHHPRTIDIDLLWFGGETRDEPHLRIPHPQISTRRFVCEPLCEVRPDLRLPGFDEPVSRILAGLPERPAVRPLGERP